jgi:hypothetical protein
MIRRLLFPVLAVTAWAQQASPGAVEAEKALRARVEKFYQLQIDKKYRQAEAFVAEDTKDAYVAMGKGDLLAVGIQQVELLADNTRAKVTVKSKSTVMIMGAGRMPFEMPAVTLWKIENGEWVWYIDQDAVRQTPFGEMKPLSSKGDSGKPNFQDLTKPPDLDALRRQVQIDRLSVGLTDAEPVQVATISNGLPGGIDISLGPERVAGVSVSLEKTHLVNGEKGNVVIRKTSQKGGEGLIHVLVSPLNMQFDVRVKAN